MRSQDSFHGFTDVEQIELPAVPATGDPVETIYGTCVVTATEESNDDSPFAGKIECRLP